MVFVRQAVVLNDDAYIDVIAEMTTCPDLVITPVIAAHESDRPRLDGGLALTHRLSGRSIARGSNDRLHVLAAALGVFDWSSDLAALFGDAERGRKIREIVREWQISSSTEDRRPDHWTSSSTATPTRAESPSRQLLGEQLESWLSCAQARPPVPALSAPDRDRSAWMWWVSSSVYGYGVCYLLAVLHAVDPVAADAASKDLTAAWDAGDSFAEWIWQWRDELARQVPLTLFGIPTPIECASDAGSRRSPEERIWLNAFSCTAPSDDFLRDIGRQVVTYVEQASPRVHDGAPAAQSVLIEVTAS